MFTDRRANTLPTRRERQPWPRGAPFKVLSLDGGGIRGIYAAELLRKCEEAFGAPIASYFDMIAGTSTGGIIALALGLQIPAADIAAFYEQDGRRIFPPSPAGRLGGRDGFSAPRCARSLITRSLRAPSSGALGTAASASWFPGSSFPHS